MNIEFIKWMVGYAEGYHWDEDKIYFPNGNYMEFTDLAEDDWEDIYYPLLLQRAIEGINKEYYLGEGTYTTYPNGSSNYDIFKDEESVMEYYYEGEDESKELSLTYIYEQEESNGNSTTR